MIKTLFISLILISQISFSQNEMWEYYNKNNNDSLFSKSIGSVSNGKLLNGSLFPPSGNNYNYFSSSSYLGGRGYVHSSVKTIICNAYKKLLNDDKFMKYWIMESCKKHGGKLWPHRTHQNGTSVDLMIPLMKNNKPYYGLSSVGTQHYFLSFDNKGRYSEDLSVCVDFEALSKMIFRIYQSSKEQNWAIKKVILKVEWRDKLLSTKYGRKLKENGVYFVKALSKKVNDMHDDHIHIDFEDNID